ncbi:MAG TPA: metallophosphoesterase [Candidatus Sulfotelmatobacter sp.]|jgi:predicted MPP superfamily phosphohydrolase|nr:metallophosphoesterase [Candidatus Sulfotelmatobacter sp.]
MHRRTLDPPRPAEGLGLAHSPLGPPHEAAPRPRAHFDPKRGWFRRIERAASLALSRHVWPRLPGISWPYRGILRGSLTLAEAEIPLRGLAGVLEGLTMLFISDVHAGPFLDPGVLAEAFEKLQAVRADVVIHGGDLATSVPQEIEPHEPAFRGLTAPCGAFAVLGNHDHYASNLPRIRSFYERCGIRLLVNDAVAIGRNGAALALAGIDDWNIGRPDLGRAIAAARAAAPGSPIVLASHNPDGFFDAADAGVSLVLAGHTHGGQVRIPGRPVLVRMSRYRLDEGRYERRDAQIVVSRGIGVCGLPVRLFCPPEALRITLRSHAA